MKNDFAKLYLKVILGLFLILTLFTGYFILDNNSYVSGDVTGKYRTGYSDEIHYLTVKNSEDGELESIEVNAIQYRKYNIGDSIYIDYNLMKKADSIIKWKGDGSN